MIYCNINGRKYRCIFSENYVCFIDVLDEERFYTLPLSTIISQVKSKMFFKVM